MSSMNRRLRFIKPRYFLLAAGICSLLAVTGLRANNQHMAVLRDAVYTADKQGGDVQTALNNLQAYVTAHMNTSLTSGNTSVYPPIQLQYTYERLVQAQAGKQGGVNNELYTQAQAYCQSLNSKDFSGRNRVPCIEKYVLDHGSKVALAATIPPSLYQFDFVDPTWSPDLAGWSLLLTVVFLLLAVVKYLLDRHARR